MDAAGALAVRRARRRKRLRWALLLVVALVASTPEVWVGFGVYRWYEAVHRDPSQVAADWGLDLNRAAIGDPKQALADARGEECAGSHPARQIYDRLHEAAVKSDAIGGWTLYVLPGKAKVHMTGLTSGTADVPTWVEAKLFSVKTTDAYGIVSHDGSVEETNHHWTIHLVRRWPVWQVCGITQDRPLFSH